jgi:predicted AAA+ superfamily ATPase
MIREMLTEFTDVSLQLNADDPTVRRILDTPNTEQLRQIIGNHKIVFIDEAQQINEIGKTAKLIFDTFNEVQLILSGSSSFDLANATQEPLTGRKRTFFMYPVSWMEWQSHVGYIRAEQDLENRLVYGLYPDVLINHAQQEVILREIADSYLYKDVLLYGNLKKPDEIRNLLQAIAFQVGNEVSYRELGQITGLDPKTVERYISILEKAFIIFRLGSFSRNLRNEIRTGRKIYFYDNGIRNAVIGHLQPFATRQDTGALWENFIICERQKRNRYRQYYANSYFWRTTQQQEVDYIEEFNGKLTACEIKYNEKRKIKIPKTFTNNYQATVSTVNRSNFRDFIS